MEYTFSSVRVAQTMRFSIAALAMGAAVGAQAQLTVPEQDVYVGLGALSIITVGYARPINSDFGLRAEYGGWATISRDDTTSGATATASLKLNHGGVFADWYPFQNGFRLVGGLTFNDIRVDFTTKGASGDTVTINNKEFSLTNESFGASIIFPTTTPYIGIGYGHQQSKDKGIGFYADAGVMIGTFTSKITTSLLAKGLVTQADLDIESQSIRDSLSKLNVLPSLSMGLVYRY